VRARIVAPPWLHERVNGGPVRPEPGNGPVWVADPADPVLRIGGPHNFIVFAGDAPTERAVARQLPVGGGSKVYGLFGHIMPALLCHVDGLAPARPIPTLRRYAIICLPRSGSRYLAAKLGAVGIGSPLEHLREPLATAITRGRLGFAASIKALEQFGQANEIFGTKLVSTFFIDASENRMAKLVKNTEWLAERGYRFVYLERSLEDAVISSYIAFQMRTWHFFGAVGDETRQKFDALQFDENAIWNEYVRFLGDKVIVDHLARRFGMKSFTYETVRDSIDGITDWLCDQLRVDRNRLKPAAAQIPIPTRSETPIYARFTDSLAVLLQSRSAYLGPRTLKRLCERTGLKRPGALKLLEEFNESPRDRASSHDGYPNRAG
jgi:LPS sulfotransferase NodH